MGLPPVVSGESIATAPIALFPAIGNIMPVPVPVPVPFTVLVLVLVVVPVPVPVPMLLLLLLVTVAPPMVPFRQDSISNDRLR